MVHQLYRFVLGGLVILSVYLDYDKMLYALVLVLSLEAVTGYTLPRILAKSSAPKGESGGLIAERIWRLVVAVMLWVSFVPFSQNLWFLPWFMGFAIMAAGLSNLCPVLMIIRKVLRRYE